MKQLHEWKKPETFAAYLTVEWERWSESGLEDSGSDAVIELARFATVNERDEFIGAIEGLVPILVRTLRKRRLPEPAVPTEVQSK